MPLCLLLTTNYQLPTIMKTFTGKTAFDLTTLLRLAIEFVIGQLTSKESFFNRVLLDRLRKLFEDDDPAPNKTK